MRLGRVIIVSVAIFLLSISSLHAQDSLWSKLYGHTGNGGVLDSDRGLCGAITSDGNYIFGGVSYSFSGRLSDFWVVRTDQNGDSLWTRNYGTAGYEEAHYLIQNGDGGYVICGDTRPSGGNYNMYIVRTDSLGDTLWTRNYGSPAGDDKGWAVIRPGDGGFLVVGNGYGSGWDLFMLRIDDNGDSLWTRRYGGPYPDVAYGVTQTADGGFALTGFYSDDDFGSTRLWLLRTDSMGDTLWTRKYSIDNGWSKGEAIEALADGGFIIAGQNYTTIIDASMLLLRVDSLGSEIWHRQFGGQFIESAQSLDITNDGGFIVGGQTDSYGGGNKDFYIVRTDSSGDSLWASYFGHNGIDYCHEIRVDHNNDIIAFGQHHIYGSQDFDFWMIKIEDGVSQGSCDYETGDINYSGNLNGLDVTFGVAYFKGGSAPPYECECTPGNTWHVAGDVNGSCSFNGLDITYLVGYFKGGIEVMPCPDCPPSD